MNMKKEISPDLEELDGVSLDALPVVAAALGPLPPVHQHPLDPPLLAALLVPHPREAHRCH